MIKPLLWIGAVVLAVPASTHVAPRGASIGPSGHATILDVPPARFVSAEPAAPAPPSPGQLKGYDDFRRAGEFQNEVREEVEALTARLRRAEGSNFVDLYYENEGEPHVVFRFLRDAPRTLAKYTSNPRFRAATARYSKAELRAAMDFMFETFRDDRIIMGGGTGNKANRVEIDVAITREEFDALVARKGVTIPEAVVLKFHASRPATEINQPLPPQVAPLVRIFARDDRPIGAVNSIDSTARVVLRDGCFRAADQGNAHVLFPLGAQAFIDGEGYLAYGRGEAPGYARVGEELIFMGSIGEVTAPELVGPIHAACGPGKVIKVNAMRSAAAERAQSRVATNANSLRQLKQMYGLSDDVARRALEQCKQQAGLGTCLMTPPRPAMRQKDCPEGSTRSSGLCRTSEGHVRPLPAWLQAIVDGAPE